MVDRGRSREGGIESPPPWWFSVYSLLVSKASLEGVNAAKRLRVREAAFGSKSGLSGIPVCNVETRRAKRGSASARKCRRRVRDAAAYRGGSGHTMCAPTEAWFKFFFSPVDTEKSGE